MAPKSKAKKGKKGEDEIWAKVDESVGNQTPATSNLSDLDDKPEIKVKGAFPGYASLAMAEDIHSEDPEEDFGGLMSAIKATTKNKKKPRKAAANTEDTSITLSTSLPFDEQLRGDTADVLDDFSAAKGPIEMTADELADEEWGPVKERGKKPKKATNGKTQEAEDNKANPVSLEGDPASVVEIVPATTAQEGDDVDLPEEGTRILSKKEKEKLKKEREKAKKKAQATAKKVTNEDNHVPPSTIVDIPPAVSEPLAEENEDEKEETGGSGAKKKKKKKPKKDEEAPPIAPAGAKKKGGISALKALMEEKKRIEEEAKRREEEERKRIEEEERKAEEEQLRKEEEKQRRKEREKAKRDLAKKEGRLLTKKQRDEKMMAERRKEALLASGVQIEGLHHQSTNGGTRKVVYSNRRKKGPEVGDATAAPASRPLSPEPVPTPLSQPLDGDSVKDNWEASSGDEESNGPITQGVKESWDASSEEETQPEPAPIVSEKPPVQMVSDPDTPARTAKALAAKPDPNPTKVELPSSESEGVNGDSADSDSGEESEDTSSSSSEELTSTQRMAAQRKAEAAHRRAQAHEAALAARSQDNLRSPICCILGHVDTGKTKLLDKIRQTNVQEGEAGGITQQIGATYFPVDAIKTKTSVLNKDGTQEYKVPGLLVIDTPGHESFTNLRSRGSSLCNIAILVVDIMHGLEPQTLESLRLLRERKTPFIVALNKIDRIYGWNATSDGAFQESLAKQKSSVQNEFRDRVEKTILAFAEQGLNAALYYRNDNPGRVVSLVPTSAITGEGIPDMIMLLVNLTQQRMSDRLMYLSELECTVLEVKVIEGLGTTIDVVLSNGILREGEKIVLCGLNGPIVTQIRALLTPQPLRELRVKSAYVHHKEVKAALGVKITAPDLEKAIAGSRLLVVGPDDDEDDLRDEIMSDLTSLLNSIDKSGRGVCVQASTLGSLEALLDFLKASRIPVSGINIGPVHKKDIMRSATMLEKAKELACILCFDVSVDKEAERLAEEMGVRLFKADIIYHLFDSFTAYTAEIEAAKRRDAAPQAVWPCRLKIIAAFCKRDPIILGVDILDGTLRVGTPLAVVKVDSTTQKKEIVELGKVTSLEINHKAQEIVKKSQAGAGVAVKIEHAVYQSSKLFGRHFDDKDEVLSHISRQSIDVLKGSFKADVTTEEWQLIRFLKPRFNIP